MRRSATAALTAGFLAALVPSGALAQRAPRAPAQAVYLQANGSAFLDDAALTRTAGVDLHGWYQTVLAPRHSYEIEVDAVSAAVATPAVLTLTLFQTDGTTPYAASTISTRNANNPNASNCSGVYAAAACYGGSRYTTIIPAGPSQQMVLRVNPNLVTNGDSVFYSIRVTDTTLKNPWFFISGDYNAFSEISNASDQVVNVTVSFWAANGSFIASTAMALNANGNVAVNAADFVDRGANPNGSITLAHDGAWGDIIAGCTTLSGTTGLSFDTYYSAVHGPKLGSNYAAND